MPSQRESREEKESLTRDKLRRLAKQFNVSFEGPVQPRRWPAKEAHHFDVIRDIWANRYEEFKNNADLDPKSFMKQKGRVRRLCINADKLKNSSNVNESTWRSTIESSIMERFEQEVICNECTHELWESQYQAVPYDPIEKENLAKKRNKRLKCRCDEGIQTDESANEDSDDERQTSIFYQATDAEVLHDPSDELEKYKIPMRPDRVIGLNMSIRYQERIDAYPMNLTHSPAKQERLIYPFLVIEAKKESDTPGFKAIEAQTAFPIRRFLKIQDRLRITSKCNLDPLVWFFAFQGDEWRLYGATLSGDKVRIFTLWLGIIESQDCALQLIQIVDFIWTWARDVYRPQVRRCLGLKAANLGSISPTSTYFRDRSISLIPGSDLQSPDQSMLSMPQNDIVSQREDYHDEQNLEDASSHPFLRWADYSYSNNIWPFHSIIRHSDIVNLSFHIFEIFDGIQLEEIINPTGPNSITLSHIFGLAELCQYISPLERGHIYQMEKYWTGASSQTSYKPNVANPDEVVNAIFFFQTCCQQKDWQIERVIYCLIWSSRTMRQLSERTGLDITIEITQGRLHSWQCRQFFNLFSRLRNICGRESVENALNGIRAVLQPYPDLIQDTNQLQGIQSQEGLILDTLVPQYIEIFDLSPYCHHSNRLVRIHQIRQGSSINNHHSLRQNNIGKGGATLALRPRSWQSLGPRFCLFVSLDQDSYSTSQLESLLRYTMTEPDIYGESAGGSASPMSADEKDFLRSWVGSFDLVNMSDG